MILILTVCAMAACQTQEKKGISEEERQKALKDSSNYTTIQWLDSTFMDLGKIPEGKVIEVAYHFRNSGDKPLIITSVSASCGCTVPEKPMEPILPGDTSLIKAKFDSKSRPNGENRKQIAVYANTVPNFQELEFRVEITDNK